MPPKQKKPGKRALPVNTQGQAAKQKKSKGAPPVNTQSQEANEDTSHEPVAMVPVANSIGGNDSPLPLATSEPEVASDEPVAMGIHGETPEGSRTGGGELANDDHNGLSDETDEVNNGIAQEAPPLSPEHSAYVVKLQSDQAEHGRRMKQLGAWYSQNGRLANAYFSCAQDVRKILGDAFRDFNALEIPVRDALKGRKNTLSIIEEQIANVFSQAFSKVVLYDETGFLDFADSAPNFSNEQASLEQLKLEVSVIENERFKVLSQISRLTDDLEKRHAFFVGRLIAVMDNLEQGFTSATTEYSRLPASLIQSASRWCRYYEVLERRILQVLQDVGIEQLPKVQPGTAIDYKTHHVEDVEFDQNFKTDTVLRQVKFGYKYGHRDLRSTHVIGVKND
jgi:molecular chaperone GrpE (heat shock protein)